MQYRPDTPEVLKNLSFVIGDSMKIGIVGRTGSGKSSIANCLLRIVELKEGRITIAGVDISTLNLR